VHPVEANEQFLRSDVDARRPGQALRVRARERDGVRAGRQRATE
jgi:hypothetical protein